jgi:cell volume regulation protein A
MDPVSLFLLLIAAIFLIGVAGELIFERTGVPDVVWLLGVGLLLGPAFGVADRETLAAIAPYFGAVTLVIVLFDGGSELRLAEASRAVPRATVMAATGFVLAAGSIAAASMAASAAGWLPASWTWLHGVTLGAILGGSSSIVIMPALRRMALRRPSRTWSAWSRR